MPRLWSLTTDYAVTPLKMSPNEPIGLIITKQQDNQYQANDPKQKKMMCIISTDKEEPTDKDEFTDIAKAADQNEQRHDKKFESSSNQTLKP